MPEVRLGGARGDDQAVVRDVAAVAERLDGEAAGVEVDAHHLAEHDLGVLLPAQDVAKRRRDGAFREDPGRHLVQQRLEQMVVRAIDQRHLDVLTAERLCGEEPAEAAADDRHPVRSHVLRPPGRRLRRLRSRVR